MLSYIIYWRCIGWRIYNFNANVFIDNQTIYTLYTCFFHLLERKKKHVWSVMIVWFSSKYIIHSDQPMNFFRSFNIWKFAGFFMFFERKCLLHARCAFIEISSLFGLWSAHRTLIGHLSWFSRVVRAFSCVSVYDELEPGMDIRGAHGPD